MTTYAFAVSCLTRNNIIQLKLYETDSGFWINALPMGEYMIQKIIPYDFVKHENIIIDHEQISPYYLQQKLNETFSKTGIYQLIEHFRCTIDDTIHFDIHETTLRISTDSSNQNFIYHLLIAYLNYYYIPIDGESLFQSLVSSNSVFEVDHQGQIINTFHSYKEYVLHYSDKTPPRSIRHYSPDKYSIISAP